MKYILLAISFIPFLSLAKELSNVEIYYKCYGQLTSDVPDDNDIILKAIINEKINGSEGCLQLLDMADLNESGDIYDYKKNTVGLKILKTINLFHNTWFASFLFDMANDFPMTYDLIEPEAAALHVTKNFLSKNIKYEEIVLGNDVLQGHRIGDKPKYYVGGGKERLEIDYNNFGGLLIDRGQLIGVKKAQKNRAVFNKFEDHLFYPKRHEKKYDIHYSPGGGLLGENSYILLNSGRTLGVTMDGGNVMPRKYTQQLVKDLLCRNLPVLDNDDVKKYVVKDSNISFAKKESCMTCHVTLDYTAALLRNTQMITYDSGGKSFASMYFNEVDPKISFDQVTHFKDLNYYKSKPHGRFVFKSLNGKLLDTEITSFDELGRAITGVDEFYSCALVRYINFFTGKSITIEDLYLRKSDILKGEHFEILEKFKKEKSLRGLVRNILNSNIYKNGE